MFGSDIRRLLPILALTICMFAAVPAAAQKAVLDVQANVSPENVLYFEGTVTPKNLSPSGQLQVRNEVDVLVEYVQKGGQFRTLPNRAIPTSNEAYEGKKLLDGVKLEGRNSTLVEISGDELSAEDQGQPLVVTGTVDLSDAQKFRIITRLRHQWAGTFPAVQCFYDISGPYPVKAGVARKRESSGLLSKAGRFLEHSAHEIGEGVMQYGGQAAGLLLTGGANPVGILQALLLGEVQQQSGALGEALRFIGGAIGAGASTTSLEQVLSGNASPQNTDLTTALVQGLVARYGGDLTSGGISDAGTVGNQQFNVENLIDGAVSQLEQDLAAQLGLRNLRINVDETTAVMTSEMPNLQGRGHFEPIIAYMLVDAALAAPWTEAVTAIFDSGNGNQMGIAAPAEAARNLARGQIDVETFLQLCRFADPNNPLLTTGGISGGTGVAAIPGTGATGNPTLLSQAQLPAGWLASGTHTVDVADLDQIIPALQLTSQLISWSGMQVVQVDAQMVTMVGLDVGEAGQELQLAQALSSAANSPWDDSLLCVSNDPPLHALQIGIRTYLLQGSLPTVDKVAQQLASAATGSSATQAGNLMDLLPGLGTPAFDGGTTPAVTPGEHPAPPPPTRPADETPAPAPAPVVQGLPGGQTAPSAPVTSPHLAFADVPESVGLTGHDYLRKAYLTTGVDDGSPVKLEGALAAGAHRLGVYVEVRDAPRDSMLTMELVREGLSLGSRLMGVKGDRRSVAYFALDGGFAPGQYWLEISEGEKLVSRILFEVK